MAQKIWTSPKCFETVHNFNSYSRKQPTLTAEKTLRIYVRKDGNLPVLLDCLLRFAWILNLIGWSGVVLHCLTKLHVSKYLSETWPVQKKNTILWFEMKLTHKWQLHDHFWPFFHHLYVHPSENWGSGNHFEVLTRSKSWLVQKLCLRI